MANLAIISGSLDKVGLIIDLQITETEDFVCFERFKVIALEAANVRLESIPGTKRMAAK